MFYVRDLLALREEEKEEEQETPQQEGNKQ